jgi:hypothetical protein
LATKAGYVDVETQKVEEQVAGIANVAIDPKTGDMVELGWNAAELLPGGWGTAASCIRVVHIIKKEQDVKNEKQIEKELGVKKPNSYRSTLPADKIPKNLKSTDKLPGDTGTQGNATPTTAAGQ